MVCSIKNEWYWLGIDAGGTSSSVSLYNQQGELLGRGRSGTGHPIHDMALVERHILDATDQALSAAGLSIGDYSRIVAGGGYAGLHLPRFREKINNWRHPFAQHYATSDLDTAFHGALDGHSGALIILGTGFSAMARMGERERYIGGQGFMLGDIGSGGWFGLQAVRHALAYRDGMCGPSQIVQAVEQHYGAKAAHLADIMIDATPNVFAQIAPMVFEAFHNGDEQASIIMNKAINDVQVVIDAFINFGVNDIVLHGSVSDALQPLLSERHQSYFVPARGGAEYGAKLFAEKQWLKD